MNRDMGKIQQIFGDIANNMTLMNQKIDDIMRTENAELRKIIYKQEKRIASMEREMANRNLVVRSVEDEEREENTEIAENG